MERNQTVEFPAAQTKIEAYLSHFPTFNGGAPRLQFWLAPSGVPCPERMAARGGSARSGPPQPPPPDAAAEAAPDSESAPRKTVLGNCARCGSGDRLKFCSRCQVVRYCSPDCQKDDVSVAKGGS